MDIIMFIKLFGGLALFLFGMNVLSSSLEKASEGRLESILEKLTGGILQSVLFGTVVTAAIQSSSATTVVVVGLVNAKILKLRQAIGIIMGANIGTTITAHVLRLSDIESTNFFLTLIKPTTLAPLMATIGIVLFFAGKTDKIKEIGNMLLGFGVLFTGMFQMEATMKPLAELPKFSELFQTMSNPVLGVLVGAGITALIQSSSASVGILQALSSTGSISCASAFPIILGQNIGTCITPIMASFGATKGAKRAALVHVCFNVVGTILFLTGLYAFEYTIGFEFWNDPITKGGIANFHSIFNISVTLLLMPFTRLLEKIAYTIIPSDKEETKITDVIASLDDRLLVSPGLAIQHGRNAVYNMTELAQENFEISKKLIIGDTDNNLIDTLLKNESALDTLQDKIEGYAIKISKKHLTENSKTEISELLHMLGEFERIGDQCENLLDASQNKKAQFSDEGLEDMKLIYSAVEDILITTIKAYKNNDVKMARRIEPLEQVIDILEDELKKKHIERLRDGKCTVDAAFPFVEALTSLERISDHCSNVAVFVISANEKFADINSHAYLSDLHNGNSPEYDGYYKEYSQKYLK